MTDNTREVQLKSTFDATGVRSGVEEAKTAVRDLGKTAEREGAKAGAGLAKTGDGAQQASQKVDRETRSMIGSIERATAAFKAGEKGGAAYFETLAAQRGISADTLKPYLDQLRQAEAAQKAAQRSLGGIGVSAAQTAAALRQVPAQFTDIATSLAAGQAPLTVFLQQGGQLKDAFGGAGAAARALGSYVLGLVNPFTLAAAAGAGLFLAYEKGAEESRAFARTLILTGNAAGTTAQQLSSIAASIAGVGLTQGAAADALNQLAATGKVGAENLGRFAAAAVQLQRVGGPAVEDTVKAFAELGKAPLQAALKLNESTNFLTASLYQQIKALEQQGRATEAAKVAQEAFAAVIEDRYPKLEANLGLLERRWLSIKDAIKGAADQALNIGRPQQLGELETTLFQLRSRRADVEANGAGLRRKSVVLAELDREIEQTEKKTLEMRKQQFVGDVLAQQAAEQLKNTEARNEADKVLEQLGVKRLTQSQQEAALRTKLLAGSVAEKDIEEAIAALRKKNNDSTADNELANQRAKLVAADAYLAKLKQISASGVFDQLDDAKLTEGQKRVIELQEQLKGSISGVTKARLQEELAIARQQAAVEVETRNREQQIAGQKRAAKEFDSLIESTNKSADAILQQAQQQEAANASLGKGKSAIAELTLAELQHQQAMLLDSNETTPKYLAALQAKIDAQARFVDALKAADFKALNAGLDEWLRSAGEMDQLYREEQRLAGLTQLERDKIVAARQVELKLAKAIAEIDKANIADDEKEQLRIKARVAAEKEASAAVNKVLRDDAARTANEIERSLTDALLRGFESGKSLAANLRDTVVNMFKTMVLRPIIQPIVAQGVGAFSSLLGFSGNALASTGAGGAGSLGQLGGLGSLLGLSGLGSAFSGGFGLALSGAGGTGLALEGAGSLLGSGAYGQAFGQAAGALAPWALGAGAGIFGGRAISGGFSAFGGSGNAAVNIGTIAGAFFGGPIGAAIGGAIGGLVNRAFGRGAKETRDTGITGMATADGFSGQAFADWFQKGGWFRSNRSGTDFSAVTAEQDATLDAGIKTLYDTTAAYAKVLGLPVEAVKGYAATFRVQWGKTEEENQKAIQDAFVSLGDQLAARYATQLAPLQKAGETLAATLQRLSTLQSFSASLANLGGVFSKLANSSVDAREQLIAMAGGMDSLSQQALGFAQNYYSRDEVAGLKAKELQAALTAAGVTTDVNTREQFRALVEGLDPNSATGRQQLAALLQLQGSFATVADYLAETGLTLGQAATQAPATDALVSPLLSGVGQQVQLAQQAVDVQYETRDATLQVVSAVQQLTEALRTAGGSSSTGTTVPGYRQPEVTLAY